MNTYRKSDANAPPDFFYVEAAGLDWLREANTVAVPRVFSVGDDHIELERIDHGPWTPKVDERFGRELARLHATGAPAFGSDWPSAFIGPLAMPNERATSWPSFYVEQRIIPFLTSIPRDQWRPFEDVIARIDGLAGAAEPPARVHGDLWRGNVLADPTGTPWVIDPAAHGGHRETDLAMMRLFGGFGLHAFAAYDEVFPLADGWEERIALHQLHPLLVHATLFGGTYVESAIAAARSYA